ncbi:iron complex transport system substrate-binding protein [Paenibacillus endophyticus]|uniref:Iron complex transport system substrate-binding protein n=1 Tax=Paenibacillus endophyticus TaxID=1294268 RepID=A0A7W5GBN7_9BACL|nr:ABC transporter substrate-binding protein [Paenibacillus endophyticus]MBB3154015.1 iron complex transport system substrate-binding protein [Paenibacillus endophyticus]
MKRNVRLLAGLMMILLALISTACAAAKTETNTTGATTEPTSQPSAEAPSAERVINSLKGDITIPTDPKRVIGLSVVYPEFLYALGVTPVAVQNYHEEYPSYLEEGFKDTVKMGIAQTPNFEAILAAAPDLIIAPIWWSDKDYDQLSKIAPTILLPERDNWKDELRDIAGVFGKEPLAESVIADLQAKETAAKQKLDTLVGDETVMYMMVMEKEIIIYGETIDRGSFIHERLGLNPIKEFPQAERSISISLEKIPEYNPDHIILQLNNEFNEAIQNRYKELLDSSLWKNMTAVKNNHVYTMAGKEWFNLGMSPLADSYAIDEVLNVFENKQ